MSSRARMIALTAIARVLLLVSTACGSRTSIDVTDDLQAIGSTSPREAGGAGGGAVTVDDAASPPFDPRTAPTRIEMTCLEMESNIQLDLPCEVGMNLIGPRGQAGVNVVQCNLSYRGPIGTMGLQMPLYVIGTGRLHQPVNIATDLSIVPSSEVLLDTRRFQLISARGTLVLDSVDLAARSFNGHIYDFGTDWTDKITGKHSPCTVPDGPIWAVPGPFL